MRAARILTIPIAILAFVTSVAGLFFNIYRDNLLVTSAMKGTDVITLFVVLPLLIAGSIYSRRGSDRWTLVWLGALGYMLYNYIFYLYGTVFNALFLAYVALVALSIYAFFLNLVSINAENIKQQFNEKTPVRSIAGFMLFIVISMGGIEVVQAVVANITGKIPEVVVKDLSLQPALVYATDLAFIMPAMALAAILLWQKKPWGYVLAPIMMIKGVVYPLALVLMALFTYSSLQHVDPLTPLYAVFCIGSLIALWFLFKNMN